MSDEQHKHLGERIIRASLVIGLAQIFLRLLGLIQTRVATQFLDPAVYDAIVVVAFQGILYTGFLVGEEGIGPSFLPVFMDTRKKQGEQPAWDFANVVLTLHSLVLVGTVLVVICFPTTIVAWLTDFAHDATGDSKRGLVSQSLVWLAPSLFGLSLGTTTYMLLNGYKRFFLAAIGDATWKLATVISLVVGIGLFHLDYRALLFGLVAGSFIKLLTHAYGLRHELHYFRPSLAWRNPQLRTMWLLLLPLFAGIFFAKARDYYNGVYVLTTLDHAGLLQANNVGRSIFQALAGLVPYTVAIAMFPFLCELADREDHAKLGQVLTQSCRMLLAVFVPAAVALAVVAVPLTTLLFLGGKLDLTQAHLIAIPTACYALVLPAYALEFVLMRGFLANRRMLSVTIIGLIFSGLSVAICYVTVVRLGWSAGWALAAVALSFVIAKTLKVLAMILYLRPTIPLFADRESLSFLVRIALLGALVGLACFAVDWGAAHLLAHTPLAHATRTLQAGRLAAAGLAGALAFILGSWAFGVREPFTMFQWTLAKVRGKWPKLPGGNGAGPVVEA